MTDDLGRRRTRSQSRDLERYGALFAARTREMKSSAMRDVMSLAQGSDIISLAGGLPDTSTFPAEPLRGDHGDGLRVDRGRALSTGRRRGCPASPR